MFPLLICIQRHLLELARQSGPLFESLHHKELLEVSPSQTVARKVVPPFSASAWQKRQAMLQSLDLPFQEIDF